MQQVDSPPNGGKIAFRYGLTIGLLLAVVSVVILLSNAFIFTDASTIILKWVLVVLSWLLGLAAYFVAGILASKQTAKVGTGSIAGLWTGIFYGIISFGLSLTLFFGVTLSKAMDIYARNPATASLTQDNQRLTLIIIGVGGEIFGLLLAIGLGAGIGSLGGLVGKHVSKRAPQAVNFYPYPQPYPAQPYPAQPYPAQPYPAQPYPAQPYPTRQVPQAESTPGGANSTDPNQPYSEHPY